jgi:hypothetical protein
MRRASRGRQSRASIAGALIAAAAACTACSSSSGGGFVQAADAGGDSARAGDAGGGDAGGSGDDGFAASRMACINKINALRATVTGMKLSPYMLEDSPTIDTCVDTQANNDQRAGIPHDSFVNNTPACMWGNAMGFAQNECGPGYGTTPAGIEKCLQDMWDESLKPNCAGCVGCTAFGGACPNCDYSGMKGYECGHYVNMSAPYFTMVACGFAGAPPSSAGGWSAQNFE